MEKITIICLIYRSIEFCDWVWYSAHKYTEELKNGEAKFLFVLNDGTEELKNHLIENNYPFIEINNKIKSEEELFKIGIGWPEYLHRVYKAWNYGIKESDTEIVCLINSDMFFSPKWLTNLLNKLNEETVVSSKLVEPLNKYGIFRNQITGSMAYRGEFGSSLSSFNEEAFINFSLNNSKDVIEPGGAFMPLLMYKKQAELVNYYPEGNLCGNNFNQIIEYGDENFIKKLNKEGIQFITTLDSIVYHLKEGEMDLKL